MSLPSKGKGITRQTSKTHLVRLTPFAYNRLWEACAAFQRAVQEHPEHYPVHEGRRITLSDTLIALCEGRINL